MKMKREMKTKMKMRNNKMDKKDKKDKIKRYLMKKIRHNNLNKYKEKIQNRANRLSLMQ